MVSRGRIDLDGELSDCQGADGECSHRGRAHGQRPEARSSQPFAARANATCAPTGGYSTCFALHIFIVLSFPGSPLLFRFLTATLGCPWQPLREARAWLRVPPTHEREGVHEAAPSREASSRSVTGSRARRRPATLGRSLMEVHQIIPM
jgi:hypothetical protein